MSLCYTQITLADRRRLHHLVAAKVPVNEMARQLGRHRSTIYREIKRNTFHDRELSDYDGYYSTVADGISKERRRRLRKLRRHPSRHSRPIMDKIIRAFSPLPAFARQSFTFDRGTEFGGFRALEEVIGACSWFCDPSAPCVESTNKRIRRFLQGTTDLAVVSQRDLLHLTRHINDQPRKCLGYRTPTEVFMAHLHGDR